MLLFLIVAGAAWKLVHKLGAFAFIPLGLLDNSVVPLPGSMDALLVVLAANRAEFWWFYSIMATVGSVIGGYLTYHLARKGGKEALEKKLKPKRAKRVYQIFEKHGFWSVFVGAIAPPPVPIVPFLAAAGALQYSRRNFLIALASGRLVRFALIGWLAGHYGKHIFGFLTKYYKPAFWTLLVLAVVGGLVGLFFYLRHRNRKRQEREAGIPDQKAA